MSSKCLRLFFAFAFVAIASPLQAAITFDSAAKGQVNAGTTVAYDHIVGPSATLLVAGVFSRNASDLILTPTFNGIPFTLVNKVFMNSPGLERWLYQYALVNPPTGAHTLSVAAASATTFAVVSATYNGAHSAQPDNSTTKWDFSGNISTTTTLTPNTDSTWTVLVGTTYNLQTGAGSTLRISGGDFGQGGGDWLGVFDSNGPIHPAAATSMTIRSGQSGGELATVMASYAPATSQPLPRLYSTSLSYVGGFRVPSSCGSDVLADGGDAIAFNPTGAGGAGSLYISSFRPNYYVAEISIPSLVKNTPLSGLNTASCLQDFVEPTEGAKSQGDVTIDPAGHAQPTGMVVLGGKLWINNGVYYDANPAQTLYTLSRPLTLATSGQVKGLYGLTSAQAGFTPSMAAKSVASLSSDWTSAFGGDLLLSKFNSNIVTSTGYGHNVFVADSSLFVGSSGTTYTASATPLFSTRENNPSGACGAIGPNVSNGVVQCREEGDGPGGTTGSTYKFWSQANLDGSVVQPRGTSTLLVYQIAAATSDTYGGYGYGCGCSTVITPGQSTCPSHNPPRPECTKNYYDPESSDAGTHGYPYLYQVVAYDMNDLVAVKNGFMDPWNPLPYDYWTLTFPFNPADIGGRTRLSNATYDSATNRIYIAQTHCCDGTSITGYKPVVHVFQVTPGN